MALSAFPLFSKKYRRDGAGNIEGTRQFPELLLSALLLELHNQLYLSRKVLQNEQSAEGFSRHNIELCEKIKTYVHWNRDHGIKVQEIASYLVKIWYFCLRWERENGSF